MTICWLQFANTLRTYWPLHKWAHVCMHTFTHFYYPKAFMNLLCLHLRSHAWKCEQDHCIQIYFGASFFRAGFSCMKINSFIRSACQNTFLPKLLCCYAKVIYSFLLCFRTSSLLLGQNVATIICCPGQNPALRGSMLASIHRGWEATMRSGLACFRQVVVVNIVIAFTFDWLYAVMMNLLPFFSCFYVCSYSKPSVSCSDSLCG